MRKRRAFNCEFKREAAIMVLNQGHPFAHIWLQLKTSENSLRGRVQQIQFERNGCVPKTKSMTLAFGIISKPACIGCEERMQLYSVRLADQFRHGLLQCVIWVLLTRDMEVTYGRSRVWAIPR